MRHTRLALPIALSLAFLAPAPARAVLDVDDAGPVMRRANFNLRVTNAGILGNAFLDVGLSNDPSFETPPGSGNEMMNYAALWVGGVTEDGKTHVSGGPLLEFRPTLAPEDRVYMAEFGRLGAKRFYDDDGDGAVDEEALNGRDDDGDFEVDEDLGMFSQELAAADYVDDRPEAVDFVYPNGEKHAPLGLTVHQEVYDWAVPGFDRSAGVTYTITNHTTQTIRELYVGLYADLDAKLRTDRAGHLNDRIGYTSYSRTFADGVDSTTQGGIIPCQRPPCPPPSCFRSFAQTFPYLYDGGAPASFPVVSVVGLSHTTDPLARMLEARSYASAPGSVSFNYGVYATARLPGQGGSPRNDDDRYAALAGRFPEANTDNPDDYAVLVSCGPFPKLEAGASLRFTVALVAGGTRDSLAAQAGNLAQIEDGVKFNLQADYQGRWPHDYDRGDTGINGHDTCVEAPAGVTFTHDADCAAKFGEPGLGPAPQMKTYTHGTCIWTDTDCSGCTGRDGYDTFYRWRDPGDEPPPPNFRLVALDHAVRVEWDNYSEILLNARLSGNSETKFKGYHIWKLADWRERPSLVPARPRWALAAYFGLDTLLSALPLAAYTDTTLDYLRILYEQKFYPMGRYYYEDSEVLNGFDFLYMVSAVYEIHEREPSGFDKIRLADTPIATEFAQRVVPHAAAVARAGAVWVVPNPFRGSADWDRPRTYGDELTRHVDFMGLPRARCTIKIWTVAGDFVAQVDHDGSGGDGEAAWDLVSRNGQEVASGVYLFTVESPLGMQRGRFVVIR